MCGPVSESSPCAAIAAVFGRGFDVVGIAVFGLAVDGRVDTPAVDGREEAAPAVEGRDSVVLLSRYFGKSAGSRGTFV